MNADIITKIFHELHELGTKIVVLDVKIVGLDVKVSGLDAKVSSMKTDLIRRNRLLQALYVAVGVSTSFLAFKFVADFDHRAGPAIAAAASPAGAATRISVYYVLFGLLSFLFSFLFPYRGLHGSSQCNAILI